jgi:hypothetical protein
VVRRAAETQIRADSTVLESVGAQPQASTVGTLLWI